MEGAPGCAGTKSWRKVTERKLHMLQLHLHRTTSCSAFGRWSLSLKWFLSTIRERFWGFSSCYFRGECPLRITGRKWSITLRELFLSAIASCSYTPPWWNSDLERFLFPRNDPIIVERRTNFSRDGGNFRAIKNNSWTEREVNTPGKEFCPWRTSKRV